MVILAWFLVNQYQNMFISITLSIFSTHNILDQVPSGVFTRNVYCDVGIHLPRNTFTLNTHSAWMKRSSETFFTCLLFMSIAGRLVLWSLSSSAGLWRHIFEVIVLSGPRAVWPSVQPCANVCLLVNSNKGICWMH